MRRLTFAVLKRLADGDFHSGERLAREFDVARATIWHALNEARAAGVEIERVHGKGYRAIDSLDWLDAAQLGVELAPHGLSVHVLDCCGSTNADMLAEAQAGAASGRVLVAEMQTQGRGRLGRTWHSGIASALTFSLLWRFERPVAALAGLSLAVGVGVARALRNQGVMVQLKWPNDLLWQGRKLGGILIEIRGDALGPCAAVIGVGINVQLKPEQRERIDQPAADLREPGMPRLSRGQWLAHVLRELAQVLQVYATSGFVVVRAEWMSYHAYQGAPVRLTLPDGSMREGEALGVDDDARLLLATAGGIEAVHTGDVSLRVRA